MTTDPELEAILIEAKVVTIRSFLDYPDLSSRSAYLAAVEALDDLARLAHAARRADA